MNIKQAQIDSFCKNPLSEVKCIILFGNNEGSIAMLQKKCAEAVCGSVNDAFRYACLEMDNISKDGGEIYAEYFAQSLMGGRRAIVVKNGDNNLAPILKNIFTGAESDNVLIISSSSLNTRSSLITWAKDRSDVWTLGCYDDREENISQSVETMLREKKLEADMEVIQFLSSRLSPDRKINQSEIDKLDIFLGERRRVSLDDVRFAVSDVAGANYEDLCYSIANGETGKAVSLFNRLIREGGEPATVVRQITYHFFKLLGCSAQIEEGKSSMEVVSSLRPPLMFYRKDAFLKQLRVWNKDRLLAVLSMLYDCERDCKTTNLPAEQCASYTILRISGAVKKFV